MKACRVCQAEVPKGSFYYCSKKCRYVGGARRKRGSPEGGPVVAPGHWRDESQRRAVGQRNAVQRAERRAGISI